MHRSMKTAAVIAAMGSLAAATLSAQGADAVSGATQRGPRGMGMGQDIARGPGGAGPGMMGGRGSAGLGNAGPGMMGGGWDTVPGWADLKKLDKPLTVETAKERVVAALKDWGYADLVVDTVTEYGNGFYAIMKEKASGKPALEAFVDPTYGTVSAGRGFEARWNTKYGRSLDWPLPSGKTITADEAKTLAQQWLDRDRITTKYELKVVELPGYYSIQLLENGKLSGLAAVNAYTSQVWYRGGRGGRFAVSDGSDAG